MTKEPDNPELRRQQASAWFSDLVTQYTDDLFAGGLDAENNFIGVAHVIRIRSQLLTPQTIEPVKQQLARVISHDIPGRNMAQVKEMAADAYLVFFQEQTEVSPVDLQVITAIGEKLPLSSGLLISKVLEKQVGYQLPEDVLKVLLSRHTISPDAVDDRAFKEKFKTGDVYLLDRTTLSGNDIKQLCFMPAAYGIEIELVYSPAVKRYFYLVGDAHSAHRSSDEQEKVVDAICHKKIPGISISLHTHGMIAMMNIDASTEDKDFAFEAKMGNPVFRAFIGGLKRAGDTWELKFREYGPYPLWGRPQSLNSDELATIFNQITESK